MSTKAIDKAITRGSMPANIPPGIIVSLPSGGKKYPEIKDQNLNCRLPSNSKPTLPTTPNPIINGTKNFARRINIFDSIFISMAPVP